MMTTKDMITAIDEEVARLEAVRRLLTDEAGTGHRIKSVKRTGKKAPGTTKKLRAKRVLSPEARERIAAAQRKRWSVSKRAAKKAARQG